MSSELIVRDDWTPLSADDPDTWPTHWGCLHEVTMYEGRRKKTNGEFESIRVVRWAIPVQSHTGGKPWWETPQGNRLRGVWWWRYVQPSAACTLPWDGD